MEKEMRPQILVHAKSIKKSFDFPLKTSILSNIDFKAYAGQSIAIVGRSGEGKSTLLQILGTLDQPCEGELYIDQHLVTSSNRSYIRNHLIGFIFQSFHLLEDYTAIENILMPAKIARKNTTKGSPAYRRALLLLENVGLSERAFHYTKFLSGGEKQRVALARAFCNDPKIIFADEPTGNLDSKTGHVIHSLLLEFAQREGKALVLVTHDKDLAALCSVRYELCQGSLRQFP